MPKVSIVLPIYNGEDCLEETLSSILNQTLVDFELICVDDGSTDSAPDILAKAASQDSRINVIHQENGGPGTARNNGLDHATGDYVCMLDADDIYSLSMLETMYSRAVDTQADIVVCRSTNFDDKTGEELESQWTVKENQLPKADTFSPEEIKDFVFTAFMGWPWDKLY
uniref:glycosyltransferase family 2 protein n=1 Tax=uncultured Parolsenella sp. TaxID=2083008 RepID=UPI002592E25F